jgi:hypothetical protein
MAARIARVYTARVKVAVAAVIVLAACGHPRDTQGGGDAPGGYRDARTADDSGARDATGGGGDGGGGSDGGGGGSDAQTGGHDAGRDAPSGPITGGPCASGAAGAAAYRIRFANAQGQAYVVYEVDGLPDKSRDHAGAYGYQIGFTPSFVDPFLGDGGLQLDDSDFVDLEITTAGIASISNATLAIYGRSFDTTTDGSFNWQTFVDTGSTPTDFVSNVPPYVWYRADMTTAIAAGDANTLIRIKAGPSSNVLVVNRIELCMQAS